MVQLWRMPAFCHSALFIICHCCRAGFFWQNILCLRFATRSRPELRQSGFTFGLDYQLAKSPDSLRSDANKSLIKSFLSSNFFIICSQMENMLLCLSCHWFIWETQYGHDQMQQINANAVMFKWGLAARSYCLNSAVHQFKNLIFNFDITSTFETDCWPDEWGQFSSVQLTLFVPVFGFVLQ